MAFQGALNSALSKIIGLWEATFLVHASATIVLVFIIFLLKMGKGDFALYHKAPWYLYLGGIIGVLITYGVVTSIPKLGAASATTAIIVGQVLTALIIDQLGLFGLKEISFTWMNFWHTVFGWSKIIIKLKFNYFIHTQINDNLIRSSNSNTFIEYILVNAYLISVESNLVTMTAPLKFLH